jgi:hypothetical protein
MHSFIGSPPNCRPECSIHPDCPSNQACIQNKCRDPCLGSCGVNAQCNVLNHMPICNCPDRYTGDAFSQCYLKPLDIRKYNLFIQIYIYI